MSSKLLTGPAVEPLSLDEAKTFLRVEHSDDDQVIGALIASARGSALCGRDVYVCFDSVNLAISRVLPPVVAMHRN